MCFNSRDRASYFRQYVITSLLLQRLGNYRCDVSFIWFGGSQKCVKENRMCWENKYVLTRSYKDKTVVGNLGHTAVETKVQVPQLNFNPSRFLPTGGRRAVIPPPPSPFIDSQPDQDRIISLLPLTQARQGIYFPLFVFHWLPEH